MRGSRGVYRVALTAVLAAVSLILLYLSTLLPTGRMGIVALAGLTPAAAVVSSGVGAGVLCYAGTGILALILLPDKGGSFSDSIPSSSMPLSACVDCRWSYF